MIEPEWLDEASPDKARDNLQDLVRLNRHWGGHSSLGALLRRVAAPRGPCTILDVGSASGDMGSEIARLWPNARVTSLDYVAHHLDDAPGPKLVGDAFRLPFAPQSFDYVFSSLLLHHFTDQQVVELLASFANVARRAVLAVDLHRTPIPYHFVPATRFALGWNPITVHDAPISVAAGWAPRELRALASAAGLRNPVVRTHGFAYRVTLYGEVNEPPR